MKRSLVSLGSALLSAGFVLAGATPGTLAQTQESEDEAVLPQAAEEISHITPQADRILREMSEYLKKASEFTFHAEVAYDSVLASGQKIQFGGVSKVTVRRPNRLHVEYRGDERRTRVVFDGQSFTICDLAANVYAVAEVSAEIDEAVDRMLEQHGFTVPIADFVYADPYAVLTENVYGGHLVGRHAVDGRPCHHLAFSQETIDWQIWIEDGPRPVPRKLVITYHNEDGSPQYAARFTQWDFQPRASDDFFKFHAPSGAERIDFLPVPKSEETTP